MEATVTVKKCKPRSLMNLHHEFGNEEIEGHKVRFCQCISGSCFWLSVDQDLYQVNTEDLMNAVLNAVMPKYTGG
jgi:hypothetical protein